MKNKVKTMQDKTPASIVCSACSKTIIHAGLVGGMRERDIQKFVEEHKCSATVQSKRDFEGEVR